MDNWAAVDTALKSAKGVAYDGCHKIYILMDANQVKLSASYGYGVDNGSTQLTDQRDRWPEIVRSWYADGCGLEFVDAVRTASDGGTKFEYLIKEGADREERYPEPPTDPAEETACESCQ